MERIGHINVINLQWVARRQAGGQVGTCLVCRRGGKDILVKKKQSRNILVLLFSIFFFGSSRVALCFVLVRRGVVRVERL